MTPMSSPVASSFIYHERQLGNLCGVHCVNNLLQGPRYGPGDFAEIGMALDRKEQKLLGETNKMKKASENYDAKGGGHFSLQVLRVALARAGLRLLPAGHPDRKQAMLDPSSAADAFVVQRHNHWLAFRRLSQCWWNLDSLLEKPQFLDAQSLVTCLGCARGGSTDRGNNIFLVAGGQLPIPRPPRGSCVDPAGRSFWHSLHELAPQWVCESNIISSPNHMQYDEEVEQTLASFADAEVKAALALAGGNHAAAMDIVVRARQSIESKLNGSVGRLARALNAAVEAVLQARTTLPQSLARLVSLLCVPSLKMLAEAASRIDCNALADKLLTALSRKAKGWLWTQGVAEAATIAVELLVALPTRSEDPSASSSSESEDSGESDKNAAQPRAPNAREAKEKAAEERALREKMVQFEALDLLCETIEKEGRPCGRPTVSDPGLKARHEAQGLMSKGIKRSVQRPEVVPRNKPKEFTRESSQAHLWTRSGTR